jgi:carboxyl-terminal processing protease
LQTERSEEHGKKKSSSWLGSIGKVAIAATVLVLVFGMGIGVGRGSIGLHANKQNKALPNDLDYTTVEEVYDTLRAQYDGKLDERKLLDGIKAGLAQATGDPYTVYFNANDAKSFNDQLDGTFSGIGAELGKDAQGNLIVVAPIAGTPASKAELRAQDVIIAIDGQSTAGISSDEAVSRIRGKKGTKVTLRIVRNKTQDLTIPIIRDNIKVPSVKWEVLDGNIGYLKISQFSDDTADLANQAATEFKSKSVTGVILDLRGDPGGRLDAAVKVSSLWLTKDTTVLQERQGGVVMGIEKATGNNVLNGVKTAVLIDAGSASASEITAGALKDNGVATLIGVKSFGKGSVQQIEQLRGGSELKVTIARWYRPNGQNIDKKGISPDKEVKMSEDDYAKKRDPQKDAAIKFMSE